MEKNCFVVSPIGEPGSPVRRHADWVLKGIVTAALTRLEYKVQRGDEFPEPGVITDHVIRALVESDLVVADLTFLNPNVFYELAIRHAVMRPAIMIARAETNVPFDLRASRVVFFDQNDFDSVEKAKDDVVAAASAIAAPGFQPTDSVSLTFRRLGLDLAHRPKPLTETLQVAQVPRASDISAGTSTRLPQGIDSAEEPSAVPQVGRSIRDLFDKIHKTRGSGSGAP